MIILSRLCAVLHKSGLVKKVTTKKPIFILRFLPFYLEKVQPFIKNNFLVIKLLWNSLFFNLSMPMKSDSYFAIEKVTGQTVLC